MIRVSTRLAAVLLGTFLVLASFPVQPSLAQAPPGSTVALTGARVIDGTGRAPIEQATLLISNGRVQAVDASAKVKIPDGAVRVDATGKTIIPGLIDAHAHLNFDKDSTLPVYDQLALRLRTFGKYGVTTVVSLGWSATDEEPGFKLRDEEAKGTFLGGARLYTAGAVVFGKTPEEARQGVDHNADLKVDIIKFHIDGTPRDMTPDIYGALIDEAHKRGLRVAVHVFYLKDAKGAVDKGVDILAHSVRDQDVDPAFVAELKRRNIGYIPTLTRDLSVFAYETTPPFFKDAFFLRGLSLYSHDMKLLSDPALQEKTRQNPQAQSIKKALEQANRNLKILSDGGVQIAMGTDAGAAGAGNMGRWQGYFEHVEMEMMVKAGLTPMQALVASTGGAARVLKLDGQVGTLQPGKRADLIVLSGNPLSDIKNTRQINSVWIGGNRLSEAMLSQAP